jgi:hypothetical protein
MKSSDYRCPICDLLKTTHMKGKESFPMEIVCERCGSMMKRIWSAPFPIVHQGKCGNAANGYKSNTVNIKKTK